jgi:hypothetical protein
MAQFYRCFIKNFATIMAPIIKLTKKTKPFFWTKECLKAWELIKQKYIEALILISPKWQLEFHVHIDASLLVVRVMLFQNVTGKSDQPIVYASRLLNRIKHNYNITHKETLVMVFVLQKVKHYLLGNKFVFYVDHMALVYSVNKPQVSGIIARWLLLFLEYDFIIVYKPSKSHVIADALLRLPHITKPTGVFNQTTYANLFYIKPKWLNDVREFLRT